ncbi:MAG: helix-turn-helix domain-containing protein [Prevotellaceae bacterium]|nr:helix-turn-helix domain-containing protein [Prevotellaceae bacterium]
MKKTRKCAFCGREFTANSGVQKYCSVSCADEAKRERKKRNGDFLKAAEPVIGLRQQEYLTFSKAAILMGCSRQYIYKLVNQGKLKASRISSRMAIIRRADIETMLEGSPYNKVVFGNRPKPASSNRQQQQKKKEPVSVSDEPLTYISGEEVIASYKVKPSWLYTSAKRNQIPICRIAGKNYYSRSHVEECLGLTADIASITDWLTKEQAFDEFGMSATAVHAYAYRHRIPTKREYGIVYYSRTHLAELRQTDMLADDRYCTVDEVSEKYGLSKANIHHITKVHGIEKRKVGVKNLLLRADVERAMAERAAKGL